MSTYPEHDKLREVKDQAEAIGEFLDFGLARIGDGMTLYELRKIDCECPLCEQRKGHRSQWHSEAEQASAIDGVVQLDMWQPTMRTITSIVAEYFGIDQDKVDAEKRRMLAALGAPAHTNGELKKTHHGEKA